MFKGIGALPQRAKSGWVYTQTLLAQNVKRTSALPERQKIRDYGLILREVEE